MKEDGRKMTKEQLGAARRRAMQLVDEGWLQADAAKAVGVHVRTVRQWGQHRREHGLASLVRDERGRALGEGRTLTAAQEKELRKLITDKMPDQLKLPFALWTRRAVAELLEQRYGLKLPVRTMGEYLKRWGFTPQKPLRKAYEQQPKAVQEWLTSSYPAIAAAAKAEGAEIFWGDQTGVNNQPSAPRSYAPRGQTPTVRQQAKRFGFSVMSAVTNRGSARWMVYAGALDSARLIEFLVRLVRLAGGRKVYLILDNLRVHHSKPVKEWAALHKEDIELFYLPSYSPELNPEERLNADLKLAIGSKVPVRTKAKLRAAATEHMTMLENTPERVKKYFGDKHVAYAAS